MLYGGITVESIIEFLKIKDKECLTGIYYPRRPITANDGGQPFEYEIVDPHSRDYRTIMGNLLTDSVVTAIKTDDSSEFKIKGYIKTQDGLFWQISAVSVVPYTEETKEGLRLFKRVVEEKVIRLLNVENPFDL